MSELYNLSTTLSDRSEFHFSQTKGKVVVIVNVASKCGFTSQYEGLEKLWQKCKDREFQMIGFPCNQFGGQEPGDDFQIASFCRLNYGVSFPIAAKCNVNGDDAHPVFQFLKKQKSGLMGLTRINWNFEKFVVDKRGQVRHRHGSSTKPQALEAEIEALLAEPEA